MSTLPQQKSITLKYQKKEGIITVMRKPTETFFPSFTGRSTISERYESRGLKGMQYRNVC